MATRLTFERFDQLLKDRVIPPETLGEFVEFDEESAVPHLVFRPDAIIGDVPPGYDVDDEIYQYERALRQRDAELRSALRPAPGIRVVAEGDSWFNLPVFIRPRAIADQLTQDKRFQADNIARWGHTLQRILKDGEYLRELDDQTQFFMLSAGGNDLQNALAEGTAIHEFDPARPLNDYLTTSGIELLQEIHDGYLRLLNDVSAAFPDIRMLTYGYDYPRPLVRQGQYIGKHLRAKGIPDDLMQEVINPVIDMVNEQIAAATGLIGSARYLNCRTKTQPFTWYDDMHPRDDGFGALAEIFADAMLI